MSKIINKITGEVIIDDALELVGEPFDRQHEDDPDYILGGKEVWTEDCVWEG